MAPATKRVFIPILASLAAVSACLCAWAVPRRYTGTDKNGNAWELIEFDPGQVPIPGTVWEVGTARGPGGFVTRYLDRGTFGKFSWRSKNPGKLYTEVGDVSYHYKHMEFRHNEELWMNVHPHLDHRDCRNRVRWTCEEKNQSAQTETGDRYGRETIDVRCRTRQGTHVMYSRHFGLFLQGRGCLLLDSGRMGGWKCRYLDKVIDSVIATLRPADGETLAPQAAGPRTRRALASRDSAPIREKPAMVPMFRSASTPRPREATRRPPPVDVPKTGADIDRDLLKRLLGGRKRRRVFRGLGGRTYVREEGARLPALERKSQNFVIALLKDDELRHAYDNWSSLGLEKKTKALTRLAQLHAQVWGVPPADMKYEALDSKRTVGFYNHVEHAMTLNTNSGMLNNREMAFNVVVHENTHHFQYKMMAKYNRGEIPPNSDIYGTVQSWIKSEREYCCPEGCANKCGYSAYRGQALETQAFKEGESATTHLRSGKSRRTFERYLEILRGEGG